MQKTQGRWWDGLLCGCLVVLAVVSSLPYGETGYDDEFSFVKTTLTYAQTGHLVYNGWAAMPLGWQIPWGALFIKLFGFSFLTLRMSTLPTAMVTIWLFFAILTRFGISRRDAYFGSLLLGLSPLFIPCAASYMTDINGLLVILLCVYLCQRAIAAPTSQSTIAWLSAAAVTNCVGGTARQIAWLGALVMIPCTAWLLRKRRGVLLAGVLLWGSSAAAIYTCLWWWRHQPYAIAESLSINYPTSFIFAKAFKSFGRLLLCFSLLIFPLLAVWFTRLRKIRPAVLISIFAFVFLFQFYNRRSDLPAHWMPWLRDTIGDLGFSPVFNMGLGAAPVTIPRYLNLFLGSVVISSGLIFIADLALNRSIPFKAAFKNLAKADGNVPWNTELWLFVPFSAAYLPLLVPRAIRELLVDRYLLGLLPILIVIVLKIYQERFRQPVPVLNFLLLLSMGLFYVAGTHNLFAMYRARAQAASMLYNAGIPDSEVQVGLDHDGWVQLEHTPTIGGWQTYTEGHDKPSDLAPDCQLWSRGMTPWIEPKYFVVVGPMPCLVPSRFPPVVYSAWLPPFRRTIYIQQRP